MHVYVRTPAADEMALICRRPPPMIRPPPTTKPRACLLWRVTANVRISQLPYKSNAVVLLATTMQWEWQTITMGTAFLAILLLTRQIVSSPSSSD